MPTRYFPRGWVVRIRHISITRKLEGQFDGFPPAPPEVKHCHKYKNIRITADQHILENQHTAHAERDQSEGACVAEEFANLHRYRAHVAQHGALFDGMFW